MPPHKRALAKPLIIAVSIILIISLVAVYVIPKYVYVNPFSSFYATGIVDHKKIGFTTENGVSTANYVLNVNLFDDDPVNNMQSGDTLGYIVTQEDWYMVEWGDIVQIKLLPQAHAELIKLYPARQPASWHTTFVDSLSLTLTSDQHAYTSGQTANFTLTIKNILPTTQTNQNLTLQIPKNLPFWVFKGGNQIYSSPNLATETQPFTLTSGQQVTLNFQWTLNDVPSGYYSVRVYAGYLGENEETSITETHVIMVNS